MKFRTDINGLRAYAVIAIMIFHFNHQWLPGALAAVDVFFVISGYLMTAIVFKGLNAKSFSLKKYYSARIRRIIPALLALVIILVVLGYFFLGPISYRSLTKESIRSLLFVSNFLYWRETGYFDPGAMSKFLLHTWTLSVEWQFYLIYPIVLAVLAKFLSISTLKKVLIGIAIAFFVLTVFISYYAPMAAYYLLPGRVWDMLIGGLAFLYPFNVSTKWKKISLECIGLAMIVGSFFLFSEHSLWPGFWVIVPTMGVFLLVQANSSSIFTNNIIFQKVGLWSYSLYLYHWPILVINHRYNLDLSFWTFAVLTFLCAVPSYYLIEIRKWKVKYILITLLIVLLPTYGIYKTKGASFRVLDKYDLTAEEFNAQYYGGGDFPHYEPAFTNPGQNSEFDYVMVGDSYSRQYVKYALKSGIRAKTWFADACLFIPEYATYLNNEELKKCTNFVNEYDSMIGQDHPTKPIIWAQSWDYANIVAKDKSFKLLNIKLDSEQYYQKIVSGIQHMIEKNENRNIYLIGVYTRPSYNIYECLSSNKLSKFMETCAEFTPPQPNPINPYIEQLANQYQNVHFINPDEGFCDERGCRMLIDNEPMFSDEGHLSVYGADIIGKYIFDKVNQYEIQQSQSKQD